MSTLDVGCGFVKRGDVCIDLDRRFKPTVVASATNLPFKDNCFQKVYAFNVLEHIRDVELALSELTRVTNGEVLIRQDRTWAFFTNFLGEGHEHVMIGRRFVKAPRLLEFLRRLLLFPAVRSDYIHKLVSVSWWAKRASLWNSKFLFQFHVVRRGRYG